MSGRGTFQKQLGVDVGGATFADVALADALEGWAMDVFGVGDNPNGKEPIGGRAGLVRQPIYW